MSARGRICTAAVALALGGCTSKGPPPDPLETVRGCWAIDVERMEATNDIPEGLKPDAWDQWMGGVRMQLEATRLHQSLMIGAQPIYDETLGISMALDGSNVVVTLTDDPLPPAVVPPEHPVPPRYDGGRPFSLRVLSQDAIEADSNYVTKETWGTSFGPLPFRRVTCGS